MPSAESDIEVDASTDDEEKLVDEASESDVDNTEPPEISITGTFD